TRAFYAQGRVALPLQGIVLAVATNVAGDQLLVRPMGVVGLALATSLAGAVNVTVLAAGLRAELLPSKDEMHKLALTLLGSGTLLVVAAGALRALDGRPAWLRLAVTVTVGVAWYALFSRVSGLHRLLLGRHEAPPE
ncbi:MAG: polysaccharide biosynthesis C-terminal domain-containing protein, partial [Candidatus Bipolaricaulota bacterium]